jgi:hypothetical protein
MLTKKTRATGQLGPPAGVCDLLAIALLCGLGIVAALTFRDYGLGWDDYTHSQYGDLLLAFYGSGFTDKRALSFVNLYMYGGGFDLLSALLAKILPFELFETRRLVGALIGLVGIAVTGRLARRLGGPVVGLVAMIMLATTPMFYGHMFMNSKDGPFAVAMCVLLLALLRVIEEYPKPSRSTVIFFGFALGLAVGTRILAVIAVLFVVFPFALLITDEARRNGLRSAAASFGRFVLVMSASLPIGYLTMGLLWPWSVIEPLNPLRAIGYFSHFFEKPWKELFDGVPVSVPDMPATYLPQLFALKLPEIMLALGVGGMVGILLFATRPVLPVRRRAGFLLVLSAAVIPVIYAMISHPALYNGLRHFIFVVPPIAVVASLGFAWALEWLHERGTGALAAGLVLCAAGVSASIVDMVRLHPYQYTYFNRVAGGVRGADRKYMLDYWGLAFKQATEQLREKIEISHEKPPLDRNYWLVAVCGPERVAEVELGPTFHTTSNPRGADFALVLREFYCSDIQAPVVTQVIRENVEFATVYDIRSRKVDNLSSTLP